MATEKHKGETELAVFREFASRCPLPIDASSIQKREGESEPDILCQLTSGEVIAFELVEICDPDVARSLHKAQSGSSAALWTSDPTATIVRKKLHKTYRTPRPVELLCYTNGRVVTPDEAVREQLLCWANAVDGPFRRVWFFGEHAVYQVWDA